MGLQINKGLVPEDYDFNRDFSKKDYEPWLKNIVNQISVKFSTNPRWDFDELMSEAWLALVESAQSFNPKISNSLLGYAKPYIYKRILEFIGVNMYTPKVRYYNIKDKPEELERVNQLETSILTDGDIMNIDGEEFSPLDLAPSGINVEHDVIAKEQSGIINNALNKKLTKRQKRAIVGRFKYDKSFKEIAKDLGCSTESARYITTKGLEKLKYEVKSCK